MGNDVAQRAQTAVASLRHRAIAGWPGGPLGSPAQAFPSWFLRIECDRCGKVQLVNQIHVPHDQLLIRQILARMRHDGCGGRAAKAELLTGVQGVSSRPVRRIVLLG